MTPEKFLLGYMGVGQTYAFDELIWAAARRRPEHFSSDETRSAIATLVDHDLLVLTDDLRLRRRA